MGGPNKRMTYLVTFDCKHSRSFQEPAPSIRELLWCPQCRRDVRVVSAPPEWSARCLHCAYSRRFGAGQSEATLRAVKHRSAHPGHVVKVYNGGMLHTIYDDRDQSVIFPLHDLNQN